VTQGTPAELKEKYSYDRLKIVPIDKQKLVGALKKIDRSYEKIADQYIIVVEDAKDAIYLIELLKPNIRQFEVLKGTMDDVFINVVGGAIDV
jgi:multidrug/hemolysin transport system ATP-binding protein